MGRTLVMQQEPWPSLRSNVAETFNGASQFQHIACHVIEI